MKRFVIIALVLSLLLVGVVVAEPAPPKLPEFFYGTITINGDPAPVNTVVVAKINGVMAGNIIVVTPGQYTELMVQNNNGNNGDVISFFVNGNPTAYTAPFSEGDAVNLNLALGGNVSVPTPNPTTPPVPTPTQPSQTTKVIGHIIAPVQKSIVITPPAGTVPWDLRMDSNNEINIGSVRVVANCDYNLEVTGSTGGYLVGEGGAGMSFPTLKNPVLVWDGTRFTTMGNRLTIYHGHPGTVDIPVKLQQVLTTDDLGIESPTILLSYVATSI